VANSAVTDASEALRDLAVEVQDVRSWTLENAKKEVTAFAFGRVPPKKKKKKPRQAAESERAMQPTEGSASCFQTSSASSSQAKAAHNQVCASLRNRGGIGVGTSEVRSSRSEAGTAESPSAASSRSAASEAGEGGGESRSETEPLSSLVGTLVDQVDGEQEEDEEEMGLECNRQNRQQECAEDKEIQKLRQKEEAKRHWAEAMKKVRLMREEEEAEKFRGQIVAALADPRIDVQDPESIISVDEDEHYSLEQLTETKVWQRLGVQPSAREFHLTDDDFERLFEMDRHDYIKLPKWKRIALKKKHNLF